MDPFLSQEAVMHATLARLTNGISPASITAAYTDWLTHLSTSPGKQTLLIQKVFRKLSRLQLFAFNAALGNCKPCIEPLAQDKRFSHALWRNDLLMYLHKNFCLLNNGGGTPQHMCMV